MFDEVRKISEAFKAIGQEFARILQPLWDWPITAETEDDMRNQNVTIDWPNLPYWVRFVARDSNRTWWAYDCEPCIAGEVWRNQGDHSAFEIIEELAPRGFTRDWQDSLFCRDDFEDQEQASEQLEEVQDIVERQLWCDVLVAAMKKRLQLKISNNPNPVGLADEAVAEYRKRYSAERER